MYFSEHILEMEACVWMNEWSFFDVKDINHFFTKSSFIFCLISTFYRGWMMLYEEAHVKNLEYFQDNDQYSSIHFITVFILLPW